MRKIIVEENELEFCSKEELEEDLLEKFQEFLSEDGEKKDYLPYRHQGITFKEILNDNQVLLTAGTSAGKTGAQAIPLFYKLKTNQIDKMLLMYPTRALLGDQKQTLQKLAKVYDLEDEIAEVKGGMNRTEVITALNKKIIIATPDSIYWFFNKNIKYSSFLIYGLAQVDEVVIDEAHLFTGLVLKNLIFLINRMKGLARMVGKKQRYHILTATVNDSLRSIHENNVNEISGKSNCGNIDVRIANKKDRFSGELFKESLKEDVIEADEKLSSVAILNSAKVAHQLFYSNTQEIKPKELEDKLKKEFIYYNKKVTIKDLLNSIEDEECKEKIKEKLEENIHKLLASIYLKDYLVEAGNLELESDNEKVFAVISDYLEDGYNRFNKIIEIANKSDNFLEELEEQIARDKYVRELYNILGLRDEIFIDTDKNEFKTIVEKEITNFKSFLADGEKLTLKYNNERDMPNIEAINYKNKTRSYKLLNKLVNNLTLDDIEEVFTIDGNKENFIIEEIGSIKLEVAIMKEILGQEFNNNWVKEINIPRYIATWKDNKDVLVVLYTGSMSNYVRDGLMDFFNQANYEQKILLSTSAVEVGVDFDCNLLITEETNAASFLQRFGRAGRNGKDGKVKVFVNEKSYNDINDILAGKGKIYRKRFSNLINEVFDPVKGMDKSGFLEAYHYIINQNLGRISSQLNEDANPQTKNLAKKLRGKINLNYGLRGTMPGVALKGGVTKNPFYILRFLENSDLVDSDSPFEIARTEKSFDSLIWQSYEETEDVYVDINFTLEYSRLMFVLGDKELTPYLRESICERYENKFLRRKDNFEAKKEELLSNSKYQQLADYDQALLEYLLSPHYELVFGFGDIFLRKDSGPIFVEDKRLTIPNQFFLYLTGDKNRQQKYLNWLNKNKVFDYEELIIDDTNYEGELNEKHLARIPGGIVLLENINGALFTLYQRLIAAQKAGEL